MMYLKLQSFSTPCNWHPKTSFFGLLKCDNPKKVRCKKSGIPSRATQHDLITGQGYRSSANKEIRIWISPFMAQSLDLAFQILLFVHFVWRQMLFVVVYLQLLHRLKFVPKPIKIIFQLGIMTPNIFSNMCRPYKHAK